jgi:hypothetical protein
MRTHVLGQAKHPLLALFGHKLTQGKNLLRTEKLDQVSAATTS